MKKIYLQPAVKVQNVESESILTASALDNKSTDFDNNNDLDEGQIESKKYHHVSLWDEDEQ